MRILSVLKRRGSIIDPTAHPLPEGVLELEKGDGSGESKAVGLSHRLSDIGRYYVVVECSELEFRCPNIKRHPVRDYIEEADEGDYVLEVFLEDPIVYRQGVEAQNHTYFLCPHQTYPKLRDFIASSVVVDFGKKRRDYWFPLITHMMVRSQDDGPFPFCYFGLLHGRKCYSLRGHKSSEKAVDPILDQEVDVYTAPFFVSVSVLPSDHPFVVEARNILEPMISLLKGGAHARSQSKAK